MGALWEMHQQNSGRRANMRQNMRTASVEEQVGHLQTQVEELEKELGDIVAHLEKKFGEDVNNDGAVAA